MKRIALLIATSLLAASSLQASPLIWRFDGVTTAASELNNVGIGGLAFELRIFLDTDLIANDPMNLADVFFPGPFQGEVEIAALGVLPVNQFNNVQYFAPGGLVKGVQFNQPAFSDIQFGSTISSDSLHLGAIPPTVPLAVNNTLQSGVFGPNGLALFGQVTSFSATLAPTIPDAGSSSLLLAPALTGLASLRRRKSN